MPAPRIHPRALPMVAALALVIGLAGCQRDAPDDATDAPGAGTPAPAPEAAPDVGPVLQEPPVVADIRQTYQCGDELRVEARFAPDGVLLDIGGRQLQLRQTVSASGARYGDGDPEFWASGTTHARLTLNGETFDCTALEVEARSRTEDAIERSAG